MADPSQRACLPTEAATTATLDKISQLSTQITQTDQEISRERRKEKRRLEEEHEYWAPLVLDLKRRLAVGTENDGIRQELKNVEEEENEARLKIRQEFKERADRLQERKVQLEANIRGLQSFLAPIRKVNEDILLEIFRLVIRPDYNWLDEALKNYDDHSPWNLAQICSQWREIVLSSPELWSGIMVTSDLDVISRRRGGKEVCNSLPRLQRALERVKGGGMHVAIMLTWSHSSLDLETVQRMIVEVSATTRRWKTLHIENSEKIIDGNFRFPVDIFSHGLPLLTRATFHMQHHKSTFPSSGLVPFRSVLDSIESTSKNLRLVHFHGYGRTEVTNGNYNKPPYFRHVSFLRTNPQEIKSSLGYLAEVLPDSALARLYGPLIARDEEQAGERVVMPHLAQIIMRLIAHQSVSGGLSTLYLGSLRGLHLVSRNGLDISAPITLENLTDLVVVSNDIRGIEFLQLENLAYLQIRLTDTEEFSLRRAQIVLDRLWETDVPDMLPWRPKNIKLENMEVAFSTFHSLATQNHKLVSLTLQNITFGSENAILGLLDGLDVSD
ncbi:hypothetical protein FRC15_002371, partial [Serendipita sp. 397]